MSSSGQSMFDALGTLGGHVARWSTGSLVVGVATGAALGIGMWTLSSAEPTWVRVAALASALTIHTLAMGVCVPAIIVWRSAWRSLNSLGLGTAIARGVLTSLGVWKPGDSNAATIELTASDVYEIDARLSQFADSAAARRGVLGTVQRFLFRRLVTAARKTIAMRLGSARRPDGSVALGLEQLIGGSLDAAIARAMSRPARWTVVVCVLLEGAAVAGVARYFLPTQHQPVVPPGITP